MSLASAIDSVRARIDAAAKASGRAASDIKLVAVSKTKPESAIREAYAAGLRAFGENYAQELEAKASALVDLRDIVWHFIGHLQTNKAKVVARRAHWVDTVDSPGLAAVLGRRVLAAGRAPVPVLVEVKLSAEGTKHGVAPASLEALLVAIEHDRALALRGLMTMPPAGDDAATRRVFDELVALRAKHGGAARLPELSMGMSQDLEIAIASGATMVRVGAAIFGERV